MKHNHDPFPACIVAFGGGLSVAGWMFFFHAVSLASGLPIAPDVSRGLTFPINNHGIVYAGKDLAWIWSIGQIFWFSGSAIIFAGIILHYIDKWTSPRAEVS